ncbi:3-Methyladenine DNA glycosylase [Ignavibacterium album JCM 16511]|uniref:Putative 3-methyladenine DNA glycosylase n=1 Tax=Ignavibacterium album (strain DSM 19864 / JCM 16511 / NBRC 101810 / Mat9-16) TaxID=945713 RepID=I0AH72_IGNAJ|nr:DNA-3-methyladenine glycosylase [Ignavibacterium album]AFH48329.1 3-Methyladenine DNA glycosylase [Ignavibacterium album JCM 16511]
MEEILTSEKLSRQFYIRPVIKVAKELLGKILIKKECGKTLAGRIVEVEAYDGKNDEASHSFKGKTKRNEVMFREGGYFYVYFTYGVHHCCNVVTGREGYGAAVLIRAVEPLTGIETMALRRFGIRKINEKQFYNLTNGPGKICEAFAFDRSHSGLDLTGDKVYITNAPLLKKSEIGISKRIGISKSTELPWRFFIKGNKFLSR